LPFLEGADPAFGMHDENADPVATPDAANGGASGIPAGGGEDIQFAAAFFQNILKGVAEKLEGDVLERQSGAVEKFKTMHVPDAADRCDIRMPERGITSGNNILQVGVWDVGIEPHDLNGQIRVGKRLPMGEMRGHIRNVRGQEKAAIPGKSRHDRFLKTFCPDAPSCADVIHGGKP
jgi:hypothetical protein